MASNNEKNKRSRTIDSMDTAGDSASFDSVLGSFQKALREKEAQLEKREKLLRKAEKLFETERERVYGITLPSDVLELNVGGTNVVVLRRTLCQIEGSMLASRFSGRWDESLEKDSHGRFFVDQSIKYFGPFLDYLRTMSNDSPEIPSLSPPTFDKWEDTKNFMRMVEYYGCTDAVYRTDIVLIRGSKNVEIRQFPERMIDSEDNMCTVVLQFDHRIERRIEAFEVELGPGTDEAIIGWTVKEKLGDGDRTFLKARLAGHANIWKMAPPGAKSNHQFGLDCKRRRLIDGAGKGHHVDSHTPLLIENTVIRCERTGGKWLVNGVEIGSCNSFSYLLPNFFNSSGLPETTITHKTVSDDAIPAIACKGKLKITKIELTKVEFGGRTSPLPFALPLLEK